MNINLSTRQAVGKLAETNLIKVLREVDGVPGLCVRYFPREVIIKEIASNQVTVTGPEAIKKGYSMSLKDENGVCFIESRS
jgi:hypothetical protein